MGHRSRLFSLVVLLGGIAIGALLTQQLRQPSGAASSLPPGQPDALVEALVPAQARAQRLGLGQDASIADVAARVTPSVVSVFSEKEVRVPEGMQHPFYSDPFFRRFFGAPQQRRGQGRRPTPKQHGLGSGVVISADGIILTNNHVVEAADTIRVGFSDGREVVAEVVGSDPKSDVAVLRVKAKNLPALAIADSSASRVGDVVLAVGNPFGLSHSVTMGIISAKGRANMGITDYEDFIQTDAAINPGNSGGALVNMRGELVGINTAIASRSGGYQGIGFAIPSNMAITIKSSILKHGRMVRGWLGVAIQNVNEDLAEALEIQRHSGVLISDVIEGAPAAQAGLKRGDLIVAVDGTETRDASQLRNVIAGKGRGARTKVKVLREGKPRSFTVTLGELPEEGAPLASGGGGSEELSEEQGLFAGLSVVELDRNTRRQQGIPAEVRGVLVSQLAPGSQAAEYGLRRGDVIVEINRRPTADLKAFRKAAKAKGKRVLLLVYREGSTIFLAIRR